MEFNWTEPMFQLGFLCGTITGVIVVFLIFAANFLRLKKFMLAQEETIENSEEQADEKQEGNN